MIRRSFLAQLLAAPLAFVAAWKAKRAPVTPPLRELAMLNFEPYPQPIVGAKYTPDVFAWPFHDGQTVSFSVNGDVPRDARVFRRGSEVDFQWID